MDLENTKEYELKRFRHNDLAQEGVQELFRLSLARCSKTRQAHKAFSKPLHPAGPTDVNGLKKIDPKTLVQDKIDLPSLPHIFSRLIALMGDSKSGIEDFARVIMKDPALSVRLLKIVNSAFYGYQGEIGTISKAVAIIGINDLYALCLGTSVISAFKTIPIELADMPSFWIHSIACGIIARTIAETKGFPNRERFFVAGLLHDIGRLIIYRYLPEQTRAVLDYALHKAMLLYHAESELLGFDHAKMGGLLIKKWKLPRELEHMVRFHHSVEFSQYPEETAVVHVADVITNAFAIGTSGEQLVPQMDSLAWKQLNLPVHLLQKIEESIDTRLSEMKNILMS